MSRFVLLSDGRKMPLLGLGCWQAAERKSIADAVKTALLTGYRLIDSAALYGNEDQVGVGIRAALDTGALRRDELFVITKLPPYGMYPGKVEGHLRESLKQLGPGVRGLVPGSSSGGIGGARTRRLPTLWKASSGQLHRPDPHLEGDGEHGSTRPHQGHRRVQLQRQTAAEDLVRV